MVSQVAIHEKRLKAVIPNSPIVGLCRISEAAFGLILKLLERRTEKEAHEVFDDMLKAYPVKKAFIKYQLWAWGLKGKTLMIIFRPKK